MNKKKVIIISIITSLSIVVALTINYMFFATGTVELDTAYENVTLKVDGKTYPQKNNGDTIQLKGGRKTFVVALPDYKEKNFVLWIQPNKQTSLKIENLELEYNDSKMEELKLPAVSGI